MTMRRPMLIATLIVGTVDGLDAFVFFGIRNGTSPMRILQSIAAGWLGRASFQQGYASAALGLATHYLVAFGIVGTCFLLSRFIPVMTKRPIASGALFGVGAYFFMNLVVIPLSAIGPQRFAAAPLVNGLLIHALGIGIPAALCAAASPPQAPRPA
jgi:hypothetical protein